MASTLISAKLPPNIDPTKAQLAYSERALPKLNEELNSQDLTTCQKALMALCDVVHDPENVTQTIKCGIVESLKGLLRNKDAVVRMKTTEVLLIISASNLVEIYTPRTVQSSKLTGTGTGPDLSPLGYRNRCFLVALCRVTVRRPNLEIAAKRHLHQHVKIPGPEGIVECDLIPVLIKKLPVEADEIKLLILDTLHRAMRVNPKQALQNHAMEVYTSLMKHPMTEIRAKAALDIKELSITITTRGKLTAMKCKIIPTLIKLLGDPSTEIRLYALKLITTLSETPEGRSELLQSLEHVSKLKRDYDSPAVRKAAQIAEKSITWKP